MNVPSAATVPLVVVIRITPPSAVPLSVTRAPV